MIVSAQHIGRIAKLKNWVRETEGNGLHVLILNFDERTSDFSVKLLKSNEEVTAKSSQLELHTPDEFSNRFPDAPILSGVGLGRSWPRETVIDFSQHLELVPSGDLPITISGSCRTIRRFTDPEDGFYIDLSFGVIVQTADDDDIVEFEHLHFNQKVLVARGRVVFRNCSFGESSLSLIVGQDDLPTKPDVTLERCVFGRRGECGLTVISGRATLVGCPFENGGVGARVSEGALLVMNHCQISNSVHGIVCPSGGTLLLYSCRFSHMSSTGVQLSNGARSRMESCVIRECLQGVVVGSSKIAVSNVVVVDSSFLSCQVGLKIGNGRVNAKVTRTNVTACTVGIFVAIGARGNNTLTAYQSSECDTPLVDLSGERCSTVTDGSQSVRPSQSARLLQAGSVLATTPALLTGAPPATAARRVLKEAGLVVSVCECCRVAERAQEFFQKCAACKEARYCSRACQKAHFWSAHDQQCKELQMRVRYLDKQGYIACAHCHSIEGQVQTEPYCGDLRGLELFHCSARCRDEYRTAH